MSGTVNNVFNKILSAAHIYRAFKVWHTHKIVGCDQKIKFAAWKNIVTRKKHGMKVVNVIPGAIICPIRVVDAI